MKTRNIFLILFTFLLLSSAAFSQITSAGSGNWSSALTWTGGLPNGSQKVIIRAEDSVYFDVPVTITDSVICYSRRIAVFDSSKVIFGNGGVYKHAVNAGKLPKATWNEGSTCLITNIVDTMPSNANQDFYNLTWDCSGQSANLNFGMVSPIIGGDIRIVNSNGWYVRLTAKEVKDPNGWKHITINGSIFVDSSSAWFTATGSSAPNDTFFVTVKGGITSKGNFQLANGSGGKVAWIVGGDVTALDGQFTTHSSAPLADSLIFNGTTKQTFTRKDTVTSSNIRFVVMNGAIVDFDTSNAGTSAGATFDLRDGGTLASGHPNGVNGNITVTGAVTLSPAANYVFDGAEGQVTGTMMPATVNNLTIDNAAGVELTQATTINGVLALKAGVFNNTVPYTLGPGGSLSLEGGSLLVTSVQDRDNAGIPQKFFVDQNFPNPFNPSTSISFGIPKRSFVTVTVNDIIGKEVATVHAGELNAGVHELHFDASRLSSGVYLYKVQAGSSVAVKRMVLLK